MKVLLDTCVIFPTVMREMLLGTAKTGLFTPIWSKRILGEWQRAAEKLGPAVAVQAEGEIALTQAAWPKSEITYPPSLEARLWLPDPHDIHVLAAAIAGHADVLVTMNAKDFPRNILAEEGLSRADPDAFLRGLYDANPDLVRGVAQSVLDEANRLSDQTWTMRGLMKKARLARLGKALSAEVDARRSGG